MHMGQLGFVTNFLEKKSSSYDCPRCGGSSPKKIRRHELYKAAQNYPYKPDLTLNDTDIQNII